MSSPSPLNQVISALITIWFICLGMAIMLGAADRYLRLTKAWLLWPLSLAFKTTKRLLRSLWKSFTQWIIHHTRNW